MPIHRQRYVSQATAIMQRFVEQEAQSLKRTLAFVSLLNSGPRLDDQIEARLDDMARIVPRPITPRSIDEGVAAVAMRILHTGVQTREPTGRQHEESVRLALTPDDSPVWRTYTPCQQGIFRNIRDSQSLVSVIADRQRLEHRLGISSEEAESADAPSVLTRLKNHIGSSTPMDFHDFSKGALIATMLTLSPTTGAAMLATEATLKATSKLTQVTKHKAADLMLGKQLTALGNRLVNKILVAGEAKGLFPSASDLRKRLTSAARVATSDSRGHLGWMLGAFVVSGAGLSLSADGLLNQDLGTNLTALFTQTHGAVQKMVEVSQEAVAAISSEDMGTQLEHLHRSITDLWPDGKEVKPWQVAAGAVVATIATSKKGMLWMRRAIGFGDTDVGAEHGPVTRDAVSEQVVNLADDVVGNTPVSDSPNMEHEAINVDSQRGRAAACSPDTRSPEDSGPSTACESQHDDISPPLTDDAPGFD